MSLLVALVLSPSAYVEGERRWRAEQERELRRADGWLSVAGLVWLTPDRPTTLGRGAGYDVRVPGGGSGPLGTVTLTGGKVWFTRAPGARVFLTGRPRQELPEGLTEMRDDTAPRPTRIDDGRVEIVVVRRGKRIGLRTYDSQNSRRKAFRGLRWYPVDAAYRIDARFVRYPKPKTLMITNVLGDVRPAPCPGYAEFRVGGRLCRLDAEDEGKTYFFNFGDRTNNRTTYGAGRFLDADAPKGGRIVLDFNRATNPPCAFTDFATCPLPPRQNALDVAIPAGALNGHAE